MRSILDLLAFMDNLMREQYLDSRWITSHCGSVSCDVSEVVGWFYTIFLEDLLTRSDLSEDVRDYIEALLK